MKTKILAMLKRSDEYVSGQLICQQLGVSRTAVWKAVNALRREGYEIDSVPNRGYRLTAMPDVFSAKEIESSLTTETFGRPVIFHEKTGSTNTDCKILLEENKKTGILVAAANQTAGKGRRGRSWESPDNTSISFSLGIIPDFPPDKAPCLTLLMALAVQKAISSQTGIKALIKWPNDIVTDKKKLCGILTEMSVEPGYVSSVVIGVGINYSQTEFDEEIAYKATSLLAATGSREKLPSRGALTAECINCFEELYEKFGETKDLSAIRDEYEKCLVNKGASVKILDPAGEYEGTARGITDLGELVVETADGGIRKVYAGEVSVRGIYGYT